MFVRTADYRRTRRPPAGRAKPKNDAKLHMPQFWRIAALGIILGATVSGCALFNRMTSPDPKPQPAAEKPVPPPAAPPVKPRRQVREIHETKEPEKLAAIDPNSLIGLDPSAVEKLLGVPARINKSDVSLVWTYASADCSLQIFFYPDIKTSYFHALKYGVSDGTGGQIEMSQNCIRRILTARNNGPS